MNSSEERRMRFNMTIEERVAVLESLINDSREDQQKANDKLDQLLALRNKGLGVFWLISTLFGTGLIGTLYLLVGWVTGKHIG